MNKIKSNIFIRFKNKTLSAKITYIVFFIYFTIVSLALLFPIWRTFLYSFMTAEEYFDPSRGVFDLPKIWVFDYWAKIFTDFNVKGNSFWTMLFNSLWIMVVRVFFECLSSILLAYAVSRFRFPGRNFLYATVIFVQTIPIITSGAAGYKLATSLGLINNPWTIWITWANGFDFQFIIMYGVFKGISMSYTESAKIDGAGQFRCLFQIVLPQAFPAILALAITQSIGVWNNYSTVMINLRNYPNLAYGLFVFNDEVNYLQNSHAVYCAAIILCMIPVTLIYSVSQKLILANITTGGLKG